MVDMSRIGWREGVLMETVRSHTISDPLPELDIAASTDALIALANSRRLQVLTLLIEQEWDVTSLAREVGISQPSLSQHLAKLKTAGLVAAERESTTIRYKCISPFVEQILALIKRDFPDTQGGLESLGR